MKSKEELHRLIDELPDSETNAAGRYLEHLRDLTDPFVRALVEASEDDEATGPGEDEGADEAWQEYLNGEARPWEEVRKDLGVD